jgi:hypothetical protein
LAQYALGKLNVLLLLVEDGVRFGIARGGDPLIVALAKFALPSLGGRNDPLVSPAHPKERHERFA